MKLRVNWNPNHQKEFPYVLSGKNGFWGEWYYIAAFESLEAAKAVADKLLENPLYEVKN